MMFLLKCPKCRQDMNYQSATMILSEKRKRCVYCGRSFSAKDNIIRTIR